MQREAFFLPAELGYRFCLLHTPASRLHVRGTVLHVPPFAEELNKSRRATALMAWALASEGWAVLQVDPLGCGDSSGEFRDASWAQWLKDLRTAYRWLTERFGGPRWLWGLRAGCLLATHAASEIEHAPNLLFWQPVLSGRQHLTHFLRVKVAGELFGSTMERTGTQTLKDRLLSGEAMEIAGYQLSPRLARALDAAELTMPGGYRGQVLWMEVCSAEPTALQAASAGYISKMEDQGLPVQASAVKGDPFWQTVEVAECATLVNATVSLMSETAQ
jgi:uncharacterized protein